MQQLIRIVLLEPSHPGNIGSVARAMSTMGLRHLYLVNPVKFPHPKAIEMAAGAVGLLNQAIIVPSLEEALADCTLIAGTSTRSRRISWPILTPREFAAQLPYSTNTVQKTQDKVAILFGPEQSGLPNSALQKCHLCICIPTDATYRSLNLAAAVQIISYELHLRMLSSTLSKSKNSTTYAKLSKNRLATAQEMEQFFNHLQDVAIAVQFLKLKAPRQLMARLRRFFLRARPEMMEINMLRGFLSAIEEYRRTHIA